MTLALQIIGTPGPSLPISIHKVKHGKPVEGLNQDERTWRQLAQVIPGDIPQPERVPMGTAPALEGLGRFLNRMANYQAEWEAIAATQHMELATTNEELAATGVASYAIGSSSSDDDDSMTLEISAEELERAATRYGTAYTTTDLLPMVRRIEWERFVRSCGQVQRIFLTIGDDGKLGVSTTSARITKDELVPYARRLKAMLADRTAEDLANDRARAAHYGVGSGLYGVWTGEQIAEQSMDDLGAPMVEERNGGPEELGLHNVEDGVVAYEPNETDLWPEEAMPVED